MKAFVCEKRFVDMAAAAVKQNIRFPVILDGCIDCNFRLFLVANFDIVAIVKKEKNSDKEGFDGVQDLVALLSQKLCASSQQDD